MAHFWQGSIWEQFDVHQRTEGEIQVLQSPVRVHLIYVRASALKGLYHLTVVHIHMMDQTFHYSYMLSSN